MSLGLGLGLGLGSYLLSLGRFELWLQAEAAKVLGVGCGDVGCGCAKLGNRRSIVWLDFVSQVYSILL